MWKTVWPASAVLAASGCAAPCAGPEQVSGVTYALFASVLTFGTTELDPAFPADETPANGASDWVFTWGGASAGPITVAIDDQAFDATGMWSDVECGNFTVEIPDQTFLAQDDSAHLFRFSGRFLVYDDRIEGAGYWSEAWTAADGTQGTFEAQDLQLRGQAVR
jgi:hypothetical protein